MNLPALKRNLQIIKEALFDTIFILKKIDENGPWILLIMVSLVLHMMIKL